MQGANVEIKQENERKLLLSCVSELSIWIHTQIKKPVKEVLDVGHHEIEELQEKLGKLSFDLNQRMNPPIIAKVNDDYLPLLKCALIQTRRKVAIDIQAKSKSTFNHNLRNSLEEKLEPFASLISQEWFSKTKAYKLPKLTDYLSLQCAEKILLKTGALNFQTRVYDEKFHLLHAPTLFLPDLRYYRTACEIRNSCVSIAYIDIDKFKDFNTEYGEPRIDRDMLPQFMNILECHVFSSGHAYRYGGDEYVVILPNKTQEDAACFLSKFQIKLKTAKYFDIDKNPTVSIGICEINESSYLTDNEIEDKAAFAKDYAKDNGRNCIAIYTEETPSESSLMIFESKN